MQNTKCKTEHESICGGKKFLADFRKWVAQIYADKNAGVFFQ